MTVDDTGYAGMHAVTQLVVRRLTPKAQRPVLVAALAAVLAPKLLKFSNEKPATFFIGRRYACQVGAVVARALKLGVLPVARPGLAGGSGGGDAGQGRGGADGAVFVNIGNMCIQAGVFFQFVSVQPREALRMNEMALDSFIAGYGGDHANVAACYTNTGNMYNAQGECTEALAEHKKGLKINIRVLGCEHDRVAASYHNIGAVYFTQGDHENALVQFQKSLVINIRVLGCDSEKVAMSYNNIGTVYKQQGDYENALLQFQICVEITLWVSGCKNLIVADSYNNFGAVYKAQGRH